MSKNPQTEIDILRSSAHVPDNIVYRAFAQETVVLNLNTGKYHGLNVSAAVMLTELKRSQTVAAAAAKLANRFAHPVAEIESDLCVLCGELLERGLIELTPSDADS